MIILAILIYLPVLVLLFPLLPLSNNDAIKYRKNVNINIIIVGIRNAPMKAASAIFLKSASNIVI